MSPTLRNHGIRRVEVTNITVHGIWLTTRDKELFVPFNEYPRFRDASVSNIFHVEQPTPNILHWPHLGMTLALESLRRFPLLSKRLRATMASDQPSRPRPLSE